MNYYDDKKKIEKKSLYDEPQCRGIGVNERHDKFNKREIIKYARDIVFAALLIGLAVLSTSHFWQSEMIKRTFYCYCNIWNDEIHTSW